MDKLSNTDNLYLHKVCGTKISPKPVETVPDCGAAKARQIRLHGVEDITYFTAKHRGKIPEAIMAQMLSLWPETYKLLPDM